MHKEVWRPVKGFETYYEVSNYGRVRSLNYIVKWSYGKTRINKGKIRKPVRNKNGYYMLILGDGQGNKKSVYIHRLVAEAFCKNPNGYDTVNHINEIKTDNKAKNLEWCTKEYNNKYNGKNQKHCKPIIQLGKDLQPIKEWESARQASQELNIEYKNILSVCNGKRNYAGQYVWRFNKCQN